MPDESLPKATPILFSAPMVQAILAGRKTQTRRIALTVGPGNWTATRSEFDDWKIEPEDKSLHYDIINIYGRCSDRLYVREEHYRYGHWEPVPGVRTKGNRQKWKFVEDTDDVLFEPPDACRKGRHHKDPATKAWHKRLARFMPRKYSRITLEITSVRVERLQDISESDAIAEGIIEDGVGWNGYDKGPWQRHAVDAYRDLWESIQGPGSWEQNPFVWVVSFKRL
jgi:hypothetical protein